MIARIGVLQADATAEQIDTWARRLLAELAVLQMQGKVGVELASSLRATIAEVRKVVPKTAPAAPVADDDDEEEDEGPELEADESEVAGDGTLRVE